MGLIQGRDLPTSVRSTDIARQMSKSTQAEPRINDRISQVDDSERI